MIQTIAMTRRAEVNARLGTENISGRVGMRNDVVSPRLRVFVSQILISQGRLANRPANNQVGASALMTMLTARATPNPKTAETVTANLARPASCGRASARAMTITTATIILGKARHLEVGRASAAIARDQVKRIINRVDPHVEDRATPGTANLIFVRTMRPKLSHTARIPLATMNALARTSAPVATGTPTTRSTPATPGANRNLEIARDWTRVALAERTIRVCDHALSRTGAGGTRRLYRAMTILNLGLSVMARKLRQVAAVEAYGLAIAVAASQAGHRQASKSTTLLSSALYCFTTRVMGEGFNSLGSTRSNYRCSSKAI